MSIITSNAALDNSIEDLAPRIEIQWEPRDNSGAVKFFFERFDYRPSDWFVNERSYLGTLSVPMADIMAESYQYVHPVTGEEKSVDGPEVMAIVKAITDRRWQLSQQPAQAPGPEEQE